MFDFLTPADITILIAILITNGSIMAILWNWGRRLDAEFRQKEQADAERREAHRRRIRRLRSQARNARAR